MASDSHGHVSELSSLLVVVGPLNVSRTDFSPSNILSRKMSHLTSSLLVITKGRVVIMVGVITEYGNPSGSLGSPTFSAPTTRPLRSTASKMEVDGKVIQ